MHRMAQPLSFRRIRLIWIIYLALAVGFMVLAQFIRSESSVTLGWRHAAQIVLGMWAASAGYSFRKKCRTRSLQAARIWSAGEMFAFASAIGVILWCAVAGMVYGSLRWFDSLFYLAGILLLIAYRPAEQNFASKVRSSHSY
jgi:hypothetical protein